MICWCIVIMYFIVGIHTLGTVITGKPIVIPTLPEIIPYNITYRWMHRPTSHNVVNLTITFTAIHPSENDTLVLDTGAGERNLKR